MGEKKPVQNHEIIMGLNGLNDVCTKNLFKPMVFEPCRSARTCGTSIYGLQVSSPNRTRSGDLFRPTVPVGSGQDEAGVEPMKSLEGQGQCMICISFKKMT